MIGFDIGIKPNYTIIGDIEYPQLIHEGKVLAIGYGKVYIIEIPFPEKIEAETFKNAQEELNQAQNYIIKGDYDKVVEHCRNALETQKKIIPALKNLLTNSKYEWIDSVNQTTFEWIDKIYKKTRDISAIPHHTPSVGHFDKFEAMSILMVTTSLLLYISKLLK